MFKNQQFRSGVGSKVDLDRKNPYEAQPMARSRGISDLDLISAMVAMWALQASKHPMFESIVKD